ncbi:hypothetical protein EAH79_16240 [Sphingomonas koreensis]|nr:hypothetical protein EAH79_16240 [Sphingomonas koreensis]
MVADEDIPALICGGLYRIRSLSKSDLLPATILALMNLPIVRRQMRARQFTRDVIDTLGLRLFDVEVPNPHSEYAREIGSALASSMTQKSDLRQKLVGAVAAIEPNVAVLAHNRPGWSMR